MQCFRSFHTAERTVEGVEAKAALTEALECCKEA